MYRSKKIDDPGQGMQFFCFPFVFSPFAFSLTKAIKGFPSSVWSQGILCIQIPISIAGIADHGHILEGVDRNVYHLSQLPMLPGFHQNHKSTLRYENLFPHKRNP